MGNNELNGYPDEADVPDYRVLPSLVLANLRHMTFRATKHPIPLGHLSADKQELLTHTHMREPLVVLRQLHDASEKVSERGIERPLPMELNFDLGKGLAPGIMIERAWCHIGTAHIAGILFQVRSRLLDFLLEVKDTTGETETEGEFREKSNSFDAQSMFNKAIFGANTTILICHQSSITASQTITGGQLAEQVRKLVEQVEPLLPILPASVRDDSQGVIAELREAAGAAVPDIGRLRRGLGSLKHIMEHASGHVVATGVLALIGELLSRAAH